MDWVTIVFIFLSILIMDENAAGKLPLHDFPWKMAKNFVDKWSLISILAMALVITGPIQKGPSADH